MFYNFASLMSPKNLKYSAVLRDRERIFIPFAVPFICSCSVAVIHRYQVMNLRSYRLANPLQILPCFFFKRLLFHQRCVQYADGLIGVDVELSGVFFQLCQQKNFVIVRDFHLMKPRKNEQSDQAEQRAIFCRFRRTKRLSCKTSPSYNINALNTA